MLRDDFQVFDLLGRLKPSVGFDKRDNNVDTLVFELMRVLQHAIRLTHARRGTDINAQLCTLALLDHLEQ